MHSTFVSESLNVREQLGDLGVDGRLISVVIVVAWILNKQEMKV
jgi:hypothetical protein